MGLKPHGPVFEGGRSGVGLLVPRPAFLLAKYVGVV